VRPAGEHRLRCGSVVETKHSTEPSNALDWADSRIIAVIRLDQTVVEPLVIPLGVVMSGEFSSGFPKRAFSEEDHSVEALILDRSDEPLGVGVQVRRRLQSIRTVR
jgi:hypothetical protein